MRSITFVRGALGALALAALVTLYFVNAAIAWMALGVLTAWAIMRHNSCRRASVASKTVVPTSALMGVFLIVVCAGPAAAQTTEAELRQLVPYAQLRTEVPGLTAEEYEWAIRKYTNELDATLPALPELGAQTPLTPSSRPYTALGPTSNVDAPSGTCAANLRLASWKRVLFAEGVGRNYDRPRE